MKDLRVICTHCGGRYSLSTVDPIARYADYTVFKAPCCGRTVDDREWKSLPDFRCETEDDKRDFANGIIRRPQPQWGI